MISCNCCGTNNAPMAKHRGYWICDDCVEKYGTYDAAAFICLAKSVLGLDQVPKALSEELDKQYDYYMKKNFSKQEEKK